MDTIFYIIMGALACLSALFLIKKNKVNKINLRGWIFSISALLLIFFGAAWAQISIHENEIQAAIVGLVLFGGIGIVFGILSFKDIGVKLGSKSTNNSSKEGFSFKALSLGILVVLSSILLIITLFFKTTGSILSSPEKIADFVTERVIADDVLPSTIKKAIVYQMMYDYDDFELEQRVMLGISGSIDEKEWVELFDLIAPEQTRIALVKNATAEFNNWIENDATYPQIEIAPQQFTNKIKDNSKEIILWVYEATGFPACDSIALNNYNEGVLSNDIKDIIGCKPPVEYRDQLASHAAILLSKQIDSANVPAVIKLEDKIAETLSTEEMLAKKEEVKKARSLFNYLFILPLILLISAITLLLFSKATVTKTLGWSTLISGGIGLILGNYLSNTQNFFDGIAVKLAESAPAPVLAIIQNFMTGIIEKTLPLTTIISIVLLVVGILFLLYSNINKIKSLLKKS